MLIRCRDCGKTWNCSRDDKCRIRVGNKKTCEQCLDCFTKRVNKRDSVSSRNTTKRAVRKMNSHCFPIKSKNPSRRY